MECEASSPFRGEGCGSSWPAALAATMPEPKLESGLPGVLKILCCRGFAGKALWELWKVYQDFVRPREVGDPLATSSC